MRLKLRDAERLSQTDLNTTQETVQPRATSSRASRRHSGRPGLSAARKSNAISSEDEEDELASKCKKPVPSIPSSMQQSFGSYCPKDKETTKPTPKVCIYCHCPSFCSHDILALTNFNLLLLFARNAPPAVVERIYFWKIHQ